MKPSAKASTKGPDVEVSARGIRRVNALYAKTELRAEVYADKARMIRKRIHKTPLTVSNPNKQGILRDIECLPDVQPLHFSVQSAVLSLLNNAQEVAPKYTLRDCAAVLDSLDAEPSSLSELESMVARYREVVLSDA